MKNKLLLGVISAGVLLTSTNAYALTGNATVDFTGNDIVNVGDTFTISMNVKDVKDTTDGIVSLGGNLVFDSNMIEYVSTSTEKAPYMFQINEEANYKLAGLDFTLENGILENTTVYEFTFRALREGNTTITLANQKLTNTEDYVDTTVIGKNIKIKVDREEEKPVQEEKIVKVEKQAKKEEVKEEIKEEVQTVKQEKVENKQVLIKIINKLLEKLNELFK